MSNILIDVDGVLVDFTGKLVQWLNAKGHAVKRGHLYSVNEFRDYALDKTMPKELIKAAAHDPNFVYGLTKPEARILGAQDLLKKLLSAGHNITIVTSPWTGPYHTQAREDFADSIRAFKGGHRIGFEWASPEERVMMPGDVLIDDRHETCVTWARQQRLAIVVDQPWNRDFPSGMGGVGPQYFQRAMHLGQIPDLLLPQDAA